MIYVYESHMGGLYTTGYEQDWDELYCEQCGDSDFLLGSFEDDDIEGVWNMLKPNDICCIGCEHKDDCMEDCEKISDSSYMDCNYGLIYVQKFLFETFPEAKFHIIYLITRDKKTGKVYANCSPNGYKFGEAYAIPYALCHQEELAEKMAISLKPWSYSETKDKSFRLVKAEKENSGNKYIYEYIIDAEPEDTEGAFHTGDGWYGWISPEEIVLTKEQTELLPYIRKT